MAKDKVKQILKLLKYPYAWQTRPKLNDKNKIVISFHFFNQSNSIYGDGKGLRQGGVLQIDVFALVDYSKAVNEIREVFIKNKFRFAQMYDDIESVGNEQIYHKVLTFNYDESEVLNEL